MPYHFYAMMSRMKYINRWGLMNNTKNENISEHSQQVAIIAHCLVLIHNKRFGGHLDAERAAVLAIFHDSTEIITGDMPTPIKYFNPQINEAYKKIENVAADKLISMLPEDFKEDFEEIIKANGEQDKELKKYVKAADKFSALIKCIKAKDTIEASLKNMNLPEAEVFEKEFLPSFSLALDEQ